MTENVQDIRSKVQGLLNQASMDPDFRQKLLTNADDVLSGAGIPNNMLMDTNQDLEQECNISCLISCWASCWLTWW